MNESGQPPKDRDEAFKGFADDLLAAEEEDKKAKKKILKEGIDEIEARDIKTINTSKVITARISEMRQQADMSPFVGTSGKIKSPRLRRSEFIELLAREVLYIGTEEMKDKGAILSLAALRQFFEEKRENWQLRDSDIPDALKWLDGQDLIPDLDIVDDEHMLVMFTAVELGEDTRKVLEAATGIAATKKNLLAVLGWEEERLDRAINQLERDGLAIIDQDEVYFPGI